MKVYILSIVIQSINLPAVVTIMTKFLKNNLLKHLWVSKTVDIGLLRPATVVHLTTKVVHICLKRPFTLPQLIAEVLDVGQE